jgi:hypothetical protein
MPGACDGPRGEADRLRRVFDEGRGVCRSREAVISLGPGRPWDAYGFLGAADNKSRVVETGDLASILAVEDRATPGARP